MSGQNWTQHLDTMRAVLGRHVRVLAALPDMERALGFAVPERTLRDVFARHGLGAPSGHLRGMVGEPCAVTEPITSPLASEVSTGMAVLQEERARAAESAKPECLDKLVKMLRASGPLPLLTVCDRLDETPGNVREAVQKGAALGYHLAIADDWVTLHKAPQRLTVRDFGGHEPGRKVVACISDIHAGSRMSRLAEMREFIRWAYEQGARLVVCPGDILDGFDPRYVHEQTHVGFDRQADEFIRHIPELPGLVYCSTSGNHDCKYRDLAGLDPGRALEDRFRVLGRSDWHHLGIYRGNMRAMGATWWLWHPDGGASKKQGVINVLAKEIDAAYAADESLPDFLVTGHLHKNVQDVNYRGVYLVACPTWQAQESPYAVRISSRWDVGGMLVEYEVRADGELDARCARMVRADRFAAS